jgi:hypothetical protein
VITPNLVAWQWEHYAEAHRDRRNLVVHVLTAPLFAAAVLLTPVAFALRHPLAGAAALALLFTVLAAQGRGHRLEAQPPLPFRSPLDVAARFFLEQVFTFPRFVLSGGFARAWRGAHPSKPA